MKYSFRKLRFPLSLVLVALALTGCSYKVYVVRHAEKADSPKNDPPLSTAGLRRSAELKQLLQNKKIKSIYSTQTARTMQTAAPIASQLNLDVKTYAARPDSKFIQLVKQNKANTLIVGHSNTVDDLVNMLAGETLIKDDLSEAHYDNIFILTFSPSGKKKTFVSEKFGTRTP